MSDIGSEQREVPQEKPSDLYGLLGVQRGATRDEIKTAFRKKALECHPDTHKGDPKAEEQFKAINEANSILDDANRRGQYDRLGHRGFYTQNGGWNPLPEQPQQRTQPRSRTETPPRQETPRPRAETRPPTSDTGSGERQRPGSSSHQASASDPFGFNFEDMFKGYEDIFGFGKPRTDQSQRVSYTEQEMEDRRKAAEQEAQRERERTEQAARKQEAAEQRRRETRARQDAEAENQRAKKTAAEQKKYQDLGGTRGRECANVFYMRYVREEVSGVLDFLVGLENPRGTTTQRDARERVLHQIDTERDAINQFQINQLKRKYEDELGGHSYDEVEHKLVQATELMQRLKMARAYLRGDLRPGSLREAGNSSSTREAFEAEFKKTWAEISTATGQVDKRAYWFMPLTEIETTFEVEKAKKWIKTQGQERGRYIKGVANSPEAAEDEQFAKQAIKKRGGWWDSVTTPDRAVNDQYNYMMEKVGTTDEDRSLIWAVKKAFVDKFTKDKGNIGKDIDAEWEAILERYRAEAEAKRIAKALEQNYMPLIDLEKQRKIREAYEANNFMVKFPREDIELYNEGLKQGFLG